MKNVLLIHAHQTWEGVSAGGVNQLMGSTIQSLFEQRKYAVKETVIQQGYDIKEEVNKHAWADIIIIQSPVFWFSTPWIHKKYVDEVLTSELAFEHLLSGDGRSRNDVSKQYGSGGKMQGKKVMFSLTWNAPEETFGHPEQTLLEGKTVDDVLIPHTTTYKFCGADFLPAFSCFDVVKNADVENDRQRLEQHLISVIGNF